MKLIEFDVERFSGACYGNTIVQEALGLTKGAMWLKKTGKSVMSVKQINDTAKALNRDVTDFIKFVEYTPEDKGGNSTDEK